ncbi:MAG TPA: hypothetical protein EYP85_11050, partial [Armatimonadetes bacterium]|nr:hypothetical protein [Armatimonadota bacterium]
SVVEAIGPCCVLLCDERERSRIPNPNLRKPCRSLQQACLACRLFGLLTEGGEGYQGNVRFSDALLREPQNWEQVECIQQQMRRPGVHCPFYCTPPNFRQFIGRKFYLHGKVVNLGELQRVDARLGVTGNRNLRRRTPPPRRQDKIQAVVPGQTFQFTVHFANVTKEDLPFLFYALVLEESMWHKIGYGKPLGFGTCKIQVTCLRLMPPRSQRERFLSFEGPVEVVDLQGEDAHQKAQELAHEISNRSDLQPQLEALRRIWGRDREPAGGYHSTPQRRHLYPTYQWFQDDRTCGGAHYRTSLADYNCQWDPMENPP